jgi:glutamine---fructose-6-phosphate transaminase (isomerizing)
MDIPLRADILAQSANLRHVLDHLSGSEAARLRAAAAFLGDDRPIIFVGMGSATYVNMPAEFYLGRYGRLAGVLNASDALYSLLPALQQANVVLSSRSGETVEVIKLAQALSAEAIPFLAVTNEPASTLAGLTPHRLWFDARKDDLVSINMVTGMMATLLLVAAAAIGREGELWAEMAPLPDLMEETVTRAWEAGDAFADLLDGIRPLYVLYRDASKGMGQCARLVLEEVARRPAVAMEAAEFRQGAIEVLDPLFGAILSLGGGRFAPLNRALAAEILTHGGRVLTLGEAWESAPSPHHLHFPLPPLPGYLRPILEIVPVQVLAYKLAERQGLRPGNTRHLPKVITTEVAVLG